MNIITAREAKKQTKENLNKKTSAEMLKINDSISLAIKNCKSYTTISMTLSIEVVELLRDNGYSVKNETIGDVRMSSPLTRISW